MAKDIQVTFKTSQETILEINNYIKSNPNINQSDLIRNALEEFFEKRNINYIHNEINKHKDAIKRLEENKKALKFKEAPSLSDKEKEFLVETKRLLEKDPKYTEGRINSYVNKFKKPKMSKTEFFKLLEKIEV